MQVVVPSVSLAARLQGTARTVFVETPSSATLFKPVSECEISGPPTTGAAPAVGGIMAGGGASMAGGGGRGCGADAPPGNRGGDAATERAIIRIEASLTASKQ